MYTAIFTPYVAAFLLNEPGYGGTDKPKGSKKYADDPIVIIDLIGKIRYDWSTGCNRNKQGLIGILCCSWCYFYCGYINKFSHNLCKWFWWSSITSRPDSCPLSKRVVFDWLGCSYSFWFVVVWKWYWWGTAIGSITWLSWWLTPGCWKKNFDESSVSDSLKKKCEWHLPEPHPRVN